LTQTSHGPYILILLPPKQVNGFISSNSLRERGFHTGLLIKPEKDEAKAEAEARKCEVEVVAEAKT